MTQMKTPGPSGDPPQPLRIAVLLSGSGTSLENLFEHIDAGLPAEVVCVVSSKKSAFGLERAERGPRRVD